MATVWKNATNKDTMFATWTDDNKKPKTLQNGEPIPINNFGINVTNFNIYYWDGHDWQRSNV